MHWCPRQTPRIGICAPKRRTRSLLIPASRGVQGPGEMQMCLGANAAISSSEISSFRLTTSWQPSSPKVLDKVVSERVVIIDQEEHRLCLVRLLWFAIRLWLAIGAVTSRIARTSLSSWAYSDGVSACAPSERASSGRLCTSTMSPSAPTATPARARGVTMYALPVPWDGSTITGK